MIPKNFDSRYSVGIIPTAFCEISTYCPLVGIDLAFGNDPPQLAVLIVGDPIGTPELESITAETIGPDSMPVNCHK
jgi:hypothetical protein